MMATCFAQPPDISADLCSAVNICLSRVNAPAAPKQSPEAERACAAVLAQWNTIMDTARAKRVEEENAIIMGRVRK